MHQNKRWLGRGALASAAALAVLLAACGSSSKPSAGATTTAKAGAATTVAAGGATTTAASGGATTTAAGGTALSLPNLSGQTVKVSGPEVGSEADGVTAAFVPFEKATGAKVDYTGSRDFETQVRVAAQSNNLPDIGFIPQPGLVRDLAPHITPVQGDVATAMLKDYDPYFTKLVTVDGKVLGIPAKSDLKSLVWYSPKLFKDNGWTVPTTWDEFTKLQSDMKAKGIAPWCIGIESGDATGWPFTDWMEDFMLRMHGPDVYDQWVNHQIPFNDPQVKDVAEAVGKIWFDDSNVLAGRSSIASTGFANAGLPILDGKCGLHRQANFYGAQFKTAKPDVTFGPDGDVNVFYLPTINDNFGKVTLIAGVYAVAFNDKPATQAAMKYIEAVDYANARIKSNKSGFLSPNKNQDTSLFADKLDQTLAGILVAASPVRFDGSDQMPSKVGAGTFWKDGTNFVNGTETVDQFLNNVEASWPKS